MKGKCKRALDVEIDGVQYKVVDRKDPCAPIHRVLARHTDLKFIIPKEYEALKRDEA